MPVKRRASEVARRQAAESQLADAQLCFVALAMAGMQPTLTCSGHPHIDAAEYDIVIGGSGMVGVLHEDLVAAAGIAEVHGGRLWLDTDGKLCVVWPLAPGPGEPDEQPPKVQASQSRKRNRAGDAR